MRLTVYNGSPRGKASNTERLLDQFLAGFCATTGNSYELFYLVREKKLSACMEAFSAAEAVLLAFPLYTFCMPAVVKAFIEELEPLCGRPGNPALGFLVHSGFPESIHSQPVRSYLEKLARRLGCPCPGTVIRGGSESLRARPESANRKLFKMFYELGACFGRSGKFDPALTARLARPVRYSRLSLPLAWLGARLGEKFYWDVLLKKNGAWEKRFARPYDPDESHT